MGQLCDDDKIILFIGGGKKTWLNIKTSKAFTVSLADEEHVDVADFFGIASGNRIDDKFERTGYHAAGMISASSDSRNHFGHSTIFSYL